MIRTFHPSVTAPVQWHWATLIGPDSLDFLHRITTVNTQALQVGQGAKGCLLNAQGKMRAYFTLWNYRESEYGLEFDGGEFDHWNESLTAAIDQYTFAEKISFTDVEGLDWRWIFADGTSEEELKTRLGIPAGETFEAGRTVAIDEEIRLCHQGSLDFGRPWITAWGRPARLMQWLERTFPEAQTISHPEIEAWRIQANRPWVGHELQQENTIPLEVGLTDSIAQNKGCYPGQEVIEKIVSFGSPPRRLAMMIGSGTPPQLRTKIFNTSDPASEIGELTSIDIQEGRFIALGLIRKIHAKEGLPVAFESGGGTGSIIRISPYA